MKRNGNITNKKIELNKKKKIIFEKNSNIKTLYLKIKANLEKIN